VNAMCAAPSAARGRTPYSHVVGPMGDQVTKAMESALAGSTSGSKPSAPESPKAKSQVRQWGGVDSNHRPTDYESAALTN
jgi:hypothetical protein